MYENMRTLVRVRWHTATSAATNLQSAVVEVSLDDEERADVISDDGGVTLALLTDQCHFAEALTTIWCNQNTDHHLVQSKL